MPALKYGHKIYPQDLAGMIGLPYVSNIWYVDYTNGADTNPGNATDQAFKTVSAAHSAATANQHDVVILVSGGTAAGAGVSESAAVAWSKGFTHLIGNAAPNGIAGRARIVSGAAGLSPFFTLSGNGCIFSDVQIGTFTDCNINFLASGDRNYFRGVHFAGIGQDDAGDDTAARSLKLTGDENQYDGCVIGLDTVARSVANYEIELSGAAARNRFYGCDILSFADNSGHFFMGLPDSVGIDRFVKFEGCNFINAIGSTATTMTDAFTVHATPGGLVILKDCLKIGATGWSDNLTNIYALAPSSNATYNQGIGFPVNPAA